ncbi:iron chelate uptake ABC transporter family permease subunit [Microbacterium sp. No. 7]|uniref:iron chelate uptake ABC transporter family permease subunit n=1 Tax=Microbacterium sp. No. 7 TaxID=1714373 RepID=UPI0006CFE6A3|nr:iron chelate uptake ABC transporter family permease subunit [Microbacterium sp. No. 7]ALJ20719.1 iron-enterobactin transporter [Microbacterium sp. No. 7]
MTLAPAASAAPPAPTRTGIARSVVVTGIGIALLAVLATLSLFVGSGGISVAAVWEALRADDGSSTALIVREFRIPRTLLAITVGIALGLSGAIMQAVTRNPLADPGILGVNAGAYTAVVFAAAVLGPSLTTGHVGVALVGALVAALVVYGIGTSGPAGGTPTKLVLTGTALGAVLTGVSFAVTLTRPDVFDRIRFWSAGSLQNRQFDTLWAVLPFIVVGVVIALALPRALNALSLGDDVAVALGSRPATTKLAGVVAVTLLCGAATAAAGPIAFVGLMIPHALRSIVGPDQRWIVPLSLVAAPILLLAADIVGRLVAPGELPAGVVTAFLGAPVLIALTRRKGARGL